MLSEEEDSFSSEFQGFSKSMATCPRCMGALTEHHRCPRGPLIRLFDGLTTVGVGGVVGALLCFEFVERPVPALVLASAALGGVLASAIRQAVSGGR